VLDVNVAVCCKATLLSRVVPGRDVSEIETLHLVCFAETVILLPGAESENNITIALPYALPVARRALAKCITYSHRSASLSLTTPSTTSLLYKGAGQVASVAMFAVENDQIETRDWRSNQRVDGKVVCINDAEAAKAQVAMKQTGRKCLNLCTVLPNAIPHEANARSAGDTGYYKRNAHPPPPHLYLLEGADAQKRRSSGFIFRWSGIQLELAVELRGFS
jgi:hypothetical protein